MVIIIFCVAVDWWEKYCRECPWPYSVADKDVHPAREKAIAACRWENIALTTTLPCRCGFIIVNVPIDREGFTSHTV